MQPHAARMDASNPIPFRQVMAHKLGYSNGCIEPGEYSAHFFGSKLVPRNMLLLRLQWHAAGIYVDRWIENVQIGQHRMPASWIRMYLEPRADYFRLVDMAI